MALMQSRVVSGPVQGHADTERHSLNNTFTTVCTTDHICTCSPVWSQFYCKKAIGHARENKYRAIVALLLRVSLWVKISVVSGVSTT